MVCNFTESWIELTNNLIQSCPDRVTPPLPFSSGEEYLRLLKEAQKESNPSSLISSRRETPKVGSPKSPPNSPNPEPSTNEELKGVFINYYATKVSSMSQQNQVSMNFLYANTRKRTFEHVHEKLNYQWFLVNFLEIFTDERMSTRNAHVFDYLFACFLRKYLSVYRKKIVFCVFSLLINLKNSFLASSFCQHFAKHLRF